MVNWKEARLILAKSIAGRSLDTPLTQPFSVKLKVYEADYPNGPPTNPKKVIYKNNDLILNNFGTLLSLCLIAYTTGNETPSGSVIDVSNGARTITIYYYNTYAYQWFYYPSANQGVRIGVGTGSSAAARTDYNLQTQVGSWTPISGNATYTSATGQVTLAGSILLSSAYTVTEAGLTIDGNDISGARRQVLMFHDVFAGVSIAAGKYAHVAYTLQL